LPGANVAALVKGMRDLKAQPVATPRSLGKDSKVRERNADCAVDPHRADSTMEAMESGGKNQLEDYVGYLNTCDAM